MALRISTPGGSDRGQRLNLQKLNDDRLEIMDKILPVDSALKVAMEDYAYSLAKMLAEPVPGIDRAPGVPFQFKHMWSEDKVGRYLGFRSPEGSRQVMEKVCLDHRVNKFCFFYELNTYFGPQPMDCEPPRHPAVCQYTVFTVVVDPQEPACHNRYVIDAVCVGLGFSQWSTDWDLKVTTGYTPVP